MSIKAKILLAILCLITLGIISGAFYFNREINLPNSSSEDKIIVEVKSGSIEGVGNSLKNKNLLQSVLAFSLYSRVAKKTIYTGYYKLPKNLSPKQLLGALTVEDYRVYKVMIPEGYRTEQIGQRYEENSIVSYDDFNKAAKGKEGRLFPDTYFFKKNEDAALVVSIMTDNFNVQTENLKLSDADLTLASIVERETAGDDRNIIAGIYKNRVDINMKLDADPTVQFAKDTISVKNLNSDERINFKFWKSITSRDYYAIDSSFNTYLNKGLPPTPICNPGLKSIEAAVNPDENDFIYFFHVDGQIYPSKTIEEHNLNKQKHLY